MVRGTVFQMMMPPTCLVVLILVGLLLRGRWHRLGRRIVWVAVIALTLTGMPVVAFSMLRALEVDLPRTPPVDHPPQAIIVLGGEYIVTHDGAPDIRPGPLTIDRLRTAAALQRRTGLPILASGGTNVPGETPVAAVMQQSLADDFRTPPRWVEAKSRDTLENARFSADILRAENITSVYVVTSAWHMPRALQAFEPTGLIVTAAPTPVDDFKGAAAGDFLPRAAGWQMTYFALHEWVGYAWYKFR